MKGLFFLKARLLTIIFTAVLFSQSSSLISCFRTIRLHVCLFLLLLHSVHKSISKLTMYVALTRPMLTSKLFFVIITLSSMTLLFCNLDVLVISEAFYTCSLFIFYIDILCRLSCIATATGDIVIGLCVKVCCFCCSCCCCCCCCSIRVEIE